VIDLGPLGAGELGGKLLFSGDLRRDLKGFKTITGNISAGIAHSGSASTRHKPTGNFSRSMGHGCHKLQNVASDAALGR